MVVVVVAVGKVDVDEVMVVLQRKGFVKIALETGAQIVPCYCFGNTQTFTSLSGISNALVYYTTTATTTTATTTTTTLQACI